MMNYLAQHCVLAQRDMWEALGSHFSGDAAKFNSQDWGTLLGAVLVFATFFAALHWIYRRQQARKQSNEPRHLFDDLCTAHRLSRKDRKRLRLLAESHGLELPSALFLRPDLLRPENLPMADERELAVYAQLAEKLFEGLEALEPAHMSLVAPSVVRANANSTVILSLSGSENTDGVPVRLEGN